MPDVYIAKSNFTAGEWSSRLAGRVDLAQFQNASKKIENWLIRPQGGIKTRPGTLFISEVKDTLLKTRLIPFEFNVTQAYIIEVGNLYFRFYTNQGRLQEVAVNVTNAADNGSGLIRLTLAAVTDSYDAFISEDAAVFTDQTTPAGEATADDMTLMPTPTAANDRCYFGFSRPFNIITLNVGTAGVGAYTVTYEYSKGNGVWAGIAVTDNTTNFKTAGSNTITFTKPTDWVPDTVNGQGPFFYIRAVSDGGTQTTQPLGTQASTDLSLVTNDYVSVAGIIGTIEANTDWQITVINATTIDLIASVFTNSYTSGGSAAKIVQIATPYLTADLFQLKYSQTADLFYITHPSYVTRKLIRLTSLLFQLKTVVFVDGPYLEENTDAAKTLDPDGTANGADKTITNAVDNGSGLIRITSASHGYSTNDGVSIKDVVGTIEANGSFIIAQIDANTFDLVGSTFTNTYDRGGIANKYVKMVAAGHTPFTAKHVESLWRFKDTTNFGYGIMKLFVDNVTMWMDVKTAFDGSGAKETWREGSFSDERGHPAAITFFENRLVLGGTLFQPQTVFGSASDGFETFTPGTTDEDPYQFSIAARQANVIRWLVPQDVIFLGTSGKEYKVTGGSTNPITPSNILVRSQTAYGSADIQGIDVESTAIFVQRARKKLRQLVFNIGQDQFIAPDLTVLNPEVTGTGIIEFVFEAEDDPRVWCVRDDGQLIVMTLLSQHQIIAWAHVISDGTFESVESIPVSTGNEVWTIANRTINAATRRYVELFSDLVDLDSAIRTDFGSPVTTVAGGLQHLEAKTVKVIGDGALYPNQTVTNQALPTALDPSAQVITIGLPFTPLVEPFQPEREFLTGSAQGRRIKIGKIILLVDKTLGLTVNDAIIPTRSTADPTGAVPPAFTGELEVSPDAPWDQPPIIKQNIPFPAEILSLFMFVEVGD